MVKWNNPNRFSKRTRDFDLRNINKKPIIRPQPPLQVLINEVINKNEINTIAKLNNYIQINKTLQNTMIYDLDLLGETSKIINTRVDFACFFGCKLNSVLTNYILNNKGSIYPSISGIIPLQIYRSELYTPYELMSGYYESIPNASLDDKIYDWYDNYKKISNEQNLFSQFAMNAHDAFIDDALKNLIKIIGKEKIIGVMGGHSSKRNSIEYGG
jgi:hypothetical protein